MYLTAILPFVECSEVKGIDDSGGPSHYYMEEDKEEAEDISRFQPPLEFLSITIPLQRWPLKSSHIRKPYRTTLELQTQQVQEKDLTVSSSFSQHGKSKEA